MNSPSYLRSKITVQTCKIGFVVFALCVMSAHLLLPSGSLNIFQALCESFALGFEKHSTGETILLQLRLPRLVAGALSGGGLAVAGCLSQSLFRNPLASPSVLGISGASSCFSSFALYTGWAGVGLYSLSSAAIFGSLVNLMLLHLMLQGRHSRQPERLLIAGLALSSLWAALGSLMVSAAAGDYHRLRAIMSWQLGGLSGVSWGSVGLLVLPVAVGIVFAYRFAPAFDVLNLGDEAARTLSVDVQLLKKWMLISVAILVSFPISVVGSLPFVGLLVPHLTRAVLGPRHRNLLVYSAINGVSVTVLGDLCARSLKAPEELEIGVFTSMLGAPFFVYMLWGKRIKNV